jgi:transcriptional regulator with XRE-family HTH domain
MNTDHPLKAYRIQHKLTQGQLASVLGVSDAMITHIENGRRPVTPKNAIEWEGRIGLSRSLLCPEIFGKLDASDTATNPHQEAA